MPERPSILVVDDDHATNRLVELTLTRMGSYHVRATRCPFTALGWLDQHRFSLALIDAMMSAMNGLTFCREVRARGGTHADMPLIVLSAATPEELGWSDLQRGPDVWLRKPIRPHQLLAAVRERLSAHSPLT